MLVNINSQRGKAFEYWVAKQLGLNRNPLSGANNINNDGTRRSGDLIHPFIEYECKYRKNISIFRWWDKLKRDAEKANKKYYALIMREQGERGRPIDAIVAIPLWWYKQLISEFRGDRHEK